MKRTTIVADEGLLLEIKQLAEEQKRAVSDVVADAMREYVQARRPTRRRPISFVGMAYSGRDDVSARAEEILATDARRLMEDRDE